MHTLWWRVGAGNMKRHSWVSKISYWWNVKGIAPRRNRRYAVNYYICSHCGSTTLYPHSLNEWLKNPCMP